MPKVLLALILSSVSCLLSPAPAAAQSVASGPVTEVVVEQEGTPLSDRVINDLLGKDVSARFKFIMERAGEVQELDV